MPVFKLETRNKPRHKLVKGADPMLAGCVRVYRNSPEDLILQIWSGKHYALVALYPEEAREIADQLRTTAYQVDNPS